MQVPAQRDLLSFSVYTKQLVSFPLAVEALLLSWATKVTKTALCARRPKVLKITATVYDFLFG
jgi:hypothetical protein